MFTARKASDKCDSTHSTFTIHIDVEYMEMCLHNQEKAVEKRFREVNRIGQFQRKFCERKEKRENYRDGNEFEKKRIAFVYHYCV